MSQEAYHYLSDAVQCLVHQGYKQLQPVLNRSGSPDGYVVLHPPTKFLLPSPASDNPVLHPSETESLHGSLSGSDHRSSAASPSNAVPEEISEASL